MQEKVEREINLGFVKRLWRCLLSGSNQSYKTDACQLGIDWCQVARLRPCSDFACQDRDEFSTKISERSGIHGDAIAGYLRNSFENQ